MMVVLIFAFILPEGFLRIQLKVLVKFHNFCYVERCIMLFVL
jgi:hypothetical protein